MPKHEGGSSHLLLNLMKLARARLCLTLVQVQVVGATHRAVHSKALGREEGRRGKMDESEGKRRGLERIGEKGASGTGTQERLSILEITCKVSCYFHWPTELFRITIEPWPCGHRGGGLRCRIAQDLLNPLLILRRLFPTREKNFISHPSWLVCRHE